MRKLKRHTYTGSWFTSYRTNHSGARDRHLPGIPSRHRHQLPPRYCCRSSCSHFAVPIALSEQADFSFPRPSPLCSGLKTPACLNRSTCVEGDGHAWKKVLLCLKKRPGGSWQQPVLSTNENRDQASLHLKRAYSIAKETDERNNKFSKIRTSDGKRQVQRKSLLGPN